MVFMYVHNFSDGHMILGCSNLTGRFWIGSLWYYRSPDEGPSVEKALTGVDFDNGLVDGFFINNKNVRNINLIYSIHCASSMYKDIVLRKFNSNAFD